METQKWSSKDNLKIVPHLKKVSFKQKFIFSLVASAFECSPIAQTNLLKRWYFVGTLYRLISYDTLQNRFYQKWIQSFLRTLGHLGQLIYCLPSNNLLARWTVESKRSLDAIAIYYQFENLEKKLFSKFERFKSLLQTVNDLLRKLFWMLERESQLRRWRRTKQKLLWALQNTKFKI